jgi:hypothetical protein
VQAPVKWRSIDTKPLTNTPSIMPTTAAKSRRHTVRRKATGASAKPNLRGGSLYDRIKHLCGVISGPGDLSTNPKYMEGYGKSRRP